MNIFIDLDDTLYMTSSLIQGGTVAEILLAELHAPLFENAKATIEEFNKKGHTCCCVSARGILDSEEINISKCRMRSDGFMGNDKPLITACVSGAKEKLVGINFFYTNYFKQKEIDKKNTVLIDNDFDEIVSAARFGISAIFFAPYLDSIDAKTQSIMDELDVKVARSWLEVGQILNDLELNNKQL